MLQPKQVELSLHGRTHSSFTSQLVVSLGEREPREAR
ncbi:hypothetical protein ACP70R_021701 [Stipagrostis hirtigluma subsp. patula]